MWRSGTLYSSLGEATLTGQPSWVVTGHDNTFPLLSNLEIPLAELPVFAYVGGMSYRGAGSPAIRPPAVRARGAGTLGCEVNLLLVSNDPRWERAVGAAAADCGGALVSNIRARDALARLTGTSTRYSHLLLDRGCADGLLQELADLTSEPAGSQTEMLMLGEGAPSHPHVGVIAAANSRLVRAALTAPPLPREAEPVAVPMADLREALAGSMIEARYQPIVRMADRQPVALEVLARLMHPVRGIVSPDRFVPQLEDAGLAALLTERISARAFAELARPGHGCDDLQITVNFPLDVLLMPEALDRLERQRQAAGIPAKRLTIELTESRPVEDLVTLGRSLERLRRLGYRAAIDDVGHAVPRLAALLALPFSSLKLDKGMVQRVATSEETRDFLERTIRQAHLHGLHVVAEGVETVALWHAMKAMGADSAQGFLAARPLPLAALPVWRDAWDRAADFPSAA